MVGRGRSAHRLTCRPGGSMPRHRRLGYSAASCVRTECRPRGQRSFIWTTGSLVPATMSCHSIVAGSPHAGQSTCCFDPVCVTTASAIVGRSIRGWAERAGTLTSATKVVIAMCFLSLCMPARKECLGPVTRGVGEMTDPRDEGCVPQSQDPLVVHHRSSRRHGPSLGSEDPRVEPAIMARWSPVMPW
jgi:hypothetical protein